MQEIVEKSLSITDLFFNNNFKNGSYYNKSDFVYVSIAIIPESMGHVEEVKHFSSCMIVEHV